VTTNDDDHRARGSVLLNAAMNSRSRRRRRGLITWRFRTFNWWRRTTTSTSVVRSLEEPATSWTSQHQQVREREEHRPNLPRETGPILRTRWPRDESRVSVPFRSANVRVLGFE
jgi:hypothetical protein